MLAAAAAAAGEPYRLKFAALDMQKIAAEDLAGGGKPRPMRFAIPHDVAVVPGKQGTWTDWADGSSEWRLEVATPDAVHLNFGFSRFRLPPSAELTIASADGKHRQGPWTHADNPVTGQLWTQVLHDTGAVVVLRVASAEKALVDVALTRVGHGYTGFGAVAKHCKSGACNTDVACLGDTDPWNENRRSVAAITVGGTDTCTGSLVNNTAGNRRLLFATATHCGITGGNVASMLAYFNYENPTCRTPGPTPRWPGWPCWRPPTIHSPAARRQARARTSRCWNWPAAPARTPSTCSGPAGTAARRRPPALRPARRPVPQACAPRSTIPASTKSASPSWKSR
jgi:hypothetical protein